MRFCEVVIQVQSLGYCPLSLGPAFIRWQEAPCRSKAVEAIQTAVAERVRWIFFHCALKVVAALRIFFRGVLPPVVSAIQVKPVCLYVFRKTFGQAHPVIGTEFE